MGAGKLFDLEAHGTSIRRECLAGLTNFMAMAYVILVVPGMLADTGMPREQATSAVIWASALGTLLMGLLGRFPAAAAPGLGVCAYFSYQICGPAGFSWQTGLGAVLISGAIFLLLTVTGMRRLILDSVPTDLRHGIVAGMGAFIAFIGMKGCGLVTADPSTFVRLGDVTRPEVLLALAGLFGTGALVALKVRGALLLGIVGTSLLSLALGVTSLPEGDLFGTASLLPTGLLMEMDIRGALSHGLFVIVISLTLADMFDSMAVLLCLASRGGMVRKDGSIPNLDRAMMADSVATMTGAALGTPTVTAYLECAAGVAAGGRTGLTAAVTALLFLLTLPALPLAGLAPAHATAPVLIVVGALMLGDVAHADFSRFEVALPVFLTVIIMPLSFNIATGFGAGIISWVLIRLFMGRVREIDPVMAALSVCFAANFAMR